jgi:hypothetical protein
MSNTHTRYISQSENGLEPFRRNIFPFVSQWPWNQIHIEPLHYPYNDRSGAPAIAGFTEKRDQFSSDR